LSNLLQKKMITNLKIYVIIALIIFASLQTYRLQNAQHERDTLQNAIAQAQVTYKQQTDKLRLRERDAAKAHAESQKHTDAIMSYQVPSDCHQAIEWMIAHQ
jgi:hypothetical protein